MQSTGIDPETSENLTCNGTKCRRSVLHWCAAFWGQRHRQCNMKVQTMERSHRQVQLWPSLPSARQHPSYGDCLDVKREYYQNCSVLGCVTKCSQSAAHSCEQFLQVQHRRGCLELYYCNTVEWSWWDSSLIWKTKWFPSVLWHCWFGHMTCENRPRYDL